MEQAKQKYFHLLAIERNQRRQTIQLINDIYSLGRSSQCSITIDSQVISRYHATFIKNNNPLNQLTTYSIIDGDLNGNKSLNGIFINGDYYSSYQLRDGDIISLEYNLSVPSQFLIKYLLVPIHEADRFLKFDRDNDPSEPSEITAKKEDYKRTILKVRDFWDELV